MSSDPNILKRDEILADNARLRYILSLSLPLLQRVFRNALADTAAIGDPGYCPNCFVFGDTDEDMCFAHSVIRIYSKIAPLVQPEDEVAA